MILQFCYEIFNDSTAMILYSSVTPSLLVYAELYEMLYLERSILAETTFIVIQRTW